MKASELREISIDELKKKRDDFRSEIFNLKFRAGSGGQIENPMRPGLLRKDIARIETILKQNENVKSDTEQKS